MGNISQSARTPYGFILVRNRLKRLKELVYRSGGSWESSLREDFRLSVRFCPNSPFAPKMEKPLVLQAIPQKLGLVMLEIAYGLKITVRSAT